MPSCAEFIIPASLRDALWIYRGDSETGARADACNDLLNRHSAGKTVIIFSDMDPEGLKIALTTPTATYWLGPIQTMWSPCLKSKHASRSGFDKQGDAMKYLSRIDRVGLSVGLSS